MRRMNPFGTATGVTVVVSEGSCSWPFVASRRSLRKNSKVVTATIGSQRSRDSLQGRLRLERAQIALGACDKASQFAKPFDFEGFLPFHGAVPAFSVRL